MLDVAEVNRRLSYDPLTGVFVWRRVASQSTQWNGRYAGKVAGAVGKNGYRYIVLLGSQVLAHRLAWLVMKADWPSTDIDHIDGNRDANAISNLRIATRSQNLGNSRMKSNNTSGFKGVNFHKARGKWRVRITVNYREILVGHFDDPIAASRAYEAKAKQVFGEFARTA